MSNQHKHHEPLSLIDRAANRAFGIAVGLGLGYSHNYLLEVRGRKSGRIFTTPVNLLEFQGRRFLISSRGETQWARNARAAGRIALRKGSRRDEFQVREMPIAERPPILKEFLDRFASSVQRFHEVPKGSPAESHAPFAARHPVFELTSVG